jgi:selenocysteine lyase/cysteine desulfurase
MSHAVGSQWSPGDEIVVTNQDHEANIGVWIRKAAEREVTVRVWEVDPETGLLDVASLIPLLNENTRWVAFTHCSNLAGTANPVADICAEVRKHCEARIIVDAVAYAPHHICDIPSLGVDAYVFSLYKVFGPHQSLLYTSPSLQVEMESQAHYFLTDDVTKHANPAGPQHAQVAACAGVIDYLRQCYEHHFGEATGSLSEQMQAVHGLIQAHEQTLAAPILDYLVNRDDVRVIGKSHVQDGDRAPTIAFRPLGQSSMQLAATLQVAGIGTEAGDFYAPRLLEGVGIDPGEGVVRLSLLHYNQLDDVEKILRELDIALG